MSGEIFEEFKEKKGVRMEEGRGNGIFKIGDRRVGNKDFNLVSKNTGCSEKP